MGEFDCMFFCKDGLSEKSGIELLKEDSMGNMIAVAQSNPNKVLFLWVVHVRSTEGNEEGTSVVKKKRQKQRAKRMEESEDGSVDGSDIGEGNCSDEEFNEIRRMRDEVRKQQKLVDDLENEIIRNRLYKNNEDGPNFSNSSGSFNSMCSDETKDDAEIAYAEPPLVHKKCVNEVFNDKIAGKDIKWVPGLIFGSKVEFKNAVREYGCLFKMWHSYMKEFEGWQIKTVNDDHNYIYHFANKLVTVKYLAGLYGNKIRRNPNWKLSEMQEEFKNTLKVDVNEAKCCRVRQKALRDVEEEMKKHYAGIRKFGGEILRSNKNNTVKIATTRVNDGDPAHFQRMYVSYDALKKAWKEGCRPVLRLDGCFLKTVCGGQLLGAVGRDGNNSILPIAMAVVETENYDSWKWFLELVVKDLDLYDGYGLTMISNQQKGLDKAINELFPHVEHRSCTRHIYSNLRNKYPSQAVRSAFWKAASATHPQTFRVAMTELERTSKGAAERIKEFEPKVWSKAFFATHSKSDSTDNNISECFNSWILKSMYMPIIDMLTDIHDMLMESLHQKRD